MIRLQESCRIMGTAESKMEKTMFGLRREGK